MPFPKDPFTIRGGCNCNSIRYEVSVPPFSERPLTPYRTPGADVGDVRIPAVYMDHCNDCRKATSSVVPMALVAEMRTIRASVLPRSEQAEGAFNIHDDDRKWKPGADLFDFRDPSLTETYLTVYKSSPARSRWFCSRCGTMMAYSVDPGVIPPEWAWPVMLDIWLGTVDRADLEKDYMRPERMLWCAKAVPWVFNLVRNGASGIPEHPLTKIDKCVGDAVEEEQKGLEILGDE